MIFTGRALVGGRAAGKVAALGPLSFWGGYDPVTGLVVDRTHAALGRSLAGSILVMPGGRGSSSSSAVLAEAIRLGTAPAAIVLSEPDAILVVGAMVAEALYKGTCPIVVLAGADHAALARAADADVVAEGGTARVTAG